jgi:hypothetical protein
MNGNAKILFFCMIFVGGAAFGQNNTKKSTLIYPPYTVKLMLASANKTSLIDKSLWNIRPSLITNPNNFFVQVYKENGGAVIRPDFYTQQFGFFCKKELQLEKITKVPFKFRLGSVQQCDWLEGKRNAGLR